MSLLLTLAGIAIALIAALWSWRIDSIAGLVLNLFFGMAMFLQALGPMLLTSCER